MKKPDKTAQDFAAVAGKVATQITAPVAQAMVEEIIDSVNDQLPGLLGTRRIKDGPLMKLYVMLGNDDGEIKVTRREVYNDYLKREKESQSYEGIKNKKYCEGLQEVQAIKNTINQSPTLSIWTTGSERQEVKIYKGRNHTTIPFADPNFETTLKNTLTTSLLTTMLTPNEMKRLRERMGKQTTVDLAAQARQTLAAPPAG